MNVNDSIMRTTFLKFQSSSTNVKGSYDEGAISCVRDGCKGKGRESNEPQQDCELG